VATQVAPRQRHVPTTSNPARTWTTDITVVIGGSYLCVYGMEGSGGYQFVGSTVQMWNRHRATSDFAAGKPWLLRFFDQIRFHPVSERELARLREDFPLSRHRLEVEETTFSLRHYNAFLAREAGSIAAFKARQQAAFEAERERWRAAGQAEYASDATVAAAAPDTELDLPPGGHAVATQVAGNVWKVAVKEGQQVAAGDVLVIVESMKMEIPVIVESGGTVLEVAVVPGDVVYEGDLLVTVNAT